MKKKFGLLLAGIVFVTVMGINFEKNSEGSFLKTNIEVLELAQASDVPCWSIIDPCYFWNCYNVTHCGGCYSQRADAWAAGASCDPGGGGDNENIR